MTNYIGALSRADLSILKQLSESVFADESEMDGYLHLRRELEHHVPCTDRVSFATFQTASPLHFDKDTRDAA